MIDIDELVERHADTMWEIRNIFGWPQVHPVYQTKPLPSQQPQPERI